MLSAAPGIAPPPVVDESSSTNATFSTLTNPDGDGKNYRLATWTANGAFAVTSPGRVQYLVVGGANYYAPIPYGNAGDVRPGEMMITAATHTITIGASGTYGGVSSIGTLVVTSSASIATNGTNALGGGGTVADHTLGFVSTITGSSVTYARAQVASPVANTGDAGTGSAAAGFVAVRWEI